MARKDSLLRLHSRLVARRDARRKALTGDLDAIQPDPEQAAIHAPRLRRYRALYQAEKAARTP